jgi:hypothetical protein
MEDHEALSPVSLGIAPVYYCHIARWPCTIVSRTSSACLGPGFQLLHARMTAVTSSGAAWMSARFANGIGRTTGPARSKPVVLARNLRAAVKEDADQVLARVSLAPAESPIRSGGIGA